MEEERVKVVLEFDKDDYNKYLFQIYQEPNKDTDKVWDAMVKEGINLSMNSVARIFGVSRKKALEIFISMAIMDVEDKVK